MHEYLISCLVSVDDAEESCAKVASELTDVVTKVKKVFTQVQQYFTCCKFTIVIVISILTASGMTKHSIVSLRMSPFHSGFDHR